MIDTLYVRPESRDRLYAKRVVFEQVGESTRVGKLLLRIDPNLHRALTLQQAAGEDLDDVIERIYG